MFTNLKLTIGNWLNEWFRTTSCRPVSSLDSQVNMYPFFSTLLGRFLIDSFQDLLHG